MTLETVVAVAQSRVPHYGRLPVPEPAPELPGGEAQTVAQQAVRDALSILPLDDERVGSRFWNPLGSLMDPGALVVIKPNWVRHRNQSGSGLESLITHTTVLEAALEYVSLALPRRVVVGDAPLQSCDFGELREQAGLDAVLQRFRRRGLNVELHDFRRTLLHGDTVGARRSEAIVGLDKYVLFDLKSESLLEPISRTDTEFRVTVYNPDLLLRTHRPGKHEYLIARDCIDADVVINLPKLKCHKKAGITGALKNMVGINGNKEYLPHHRKGAPTDGGDCYATSSWLKRQAESLIDAANRSSGMLQSLLSRSSEAAVRAATFLGDDNNLEGSWWGNDTVWRMTLDLQRILRYGRPDGTLAASPQRHVISITDAIIAGEGDGPLAPTPIPAGFVTAALNTAAADWIHARLMGFEPHKIPVVREAFGSYSYGLADFRPADICVRFADREIGAEDVYPLGERGFRPASGWLNHCELERCDWSLKS